jgi:hypothetical protein
MQSSGYCIGPLLVALLESTEHEQERVGFADSRDPKFDIDTPRTTYEERDGSQNKEHGHARFVVFGGLDPYEWRDSESTSESTPESSHE